MAKERLTREVGLFFMWWSMQVKGRKAGRVRISRKL